MSSCSIKINELKDRLDGVSGYSDFYIFKKLTKISLIIYDIEKYVNECEEFYNKFYIGENNIYDNN